MPIATPTVIPVRRYPWQPVIVIAVVQINVIVADLEQSRAVLRTSGDGFRPAQPARGGPGRGLGVDEYGRYRRPALAGFRFLVDETAPQPSVGGPQVDLELESVQRLEEVIAGLDAVGATVIKQPTDMPWGQRFAIVLDPDGPSRAQGAAALRGDGTAEYWTAFASGPAAFLRVPRRERASRW